MNSLASFYYQMYEQERQKVAVEEQSSDQIDSKATYPQAGDRSGQLSAVAQTYRKNAQALSEELHR